MQGTCSWYHFHDILLNYHFLGLGLQDQRLWMSFMILDSMTNLSSRDILSAVGYHSKVSPCPLISSIRLYSKKLFPELTRMLWNIVVLIHITWLWSQRFPDACFLWILMYFCSFYELWSYFCLSYCEILKKHLTDSNFFALIVSGHVSTTVLKGKLSTVLIVNLSTPLESKFNRCYKYSHVLNSSSSEKTPGWKGAFFLSFQHLL